jgi:hypothetical protein
LHFQFIRFCSCDGGVLKVCSRTGDRDRFVLDIHNEVLAIIRMKPAAHHFLYFAAKAEPAFIEPAGIDELPTVKINQPDDRSVLETGEIKIQFIAILGKGIQGRC